MARQQMLMMREPALAMLMGALPMGQNFGYENEYEEEEIVYGNDYGYGFGLHSPYDVSQDIGLPGMGWGGIPVPPAAPPYYGWGAAAAPAAVAPVPMHPAVARKTPAVHPSHPAHPAHAQEAAKRWELSNPHSTASRTALLDPNRDSTIKVERYSFSWSPTANLVLGTASAIPTFTQQPSTSIKGQRVIMNAPLPGFVTVATLQIANVNVLVGGAEDAFTYSPLAMGVMLDLPRLDPQNRATASGNYTGVLPPGYTSAGQFQFVITLQGPATMAGGYGQ
jgi:hypothetical protein